MMGFADVERGGRRSFERIVMRAEDDRQSQSDERGPSHVGVVAPRAFLGNAPGSVAHDAEQGVAQRGSIVQLRVPRRAVAAPEPGSTEARSETARSSLAELRHDIEALEALVSGWDERERNAVAALERALDALHKEALTRIIRALKSNPAAAAALREAAADEVVYAVLRHHEILRPSLQERVEAALASVRPQLAGHGGDVELVAIEPPDVVSVRLLGSCDGCSAAGLTMKAGVEKAIQEQCPEIRQVRVVNGSLASPGGSSVQFVSPFAAAERAGWVPATRLGEIPEGGVLALELGSHSLLLSRIGTSVSCFENACAHLGMPLDDGEVCAGVITCRHHGFRFALESGECLTVPEVQLQTHAARVRGDAVEVRFS
jgi:Fe-S cluster biogenesis protein NfuA/nitrite reductase/ring-hydroxylating ferredoxin subunit